jgi:hypothetical protein
MTEATDLLKLIWPSGVPVEDLDTACRVRDALKSAPIPTAGVRLVAPATSERRSWLPKRDEYGAIAAALCVSLHDAKTPQLAPQIAKAIGFESIQVQRCLQGLLTRKRVKRTGNRGSYRYSLADSPR